MELSPRFSNSQLIAIIEEAAVYICACPAQLCEQLLHLRELFEYQRNCQARSAAPEVHDLIATATIAAHRELEDCLDQVLTVEGWDRMTLKMPQGLRIIRDEALKSLGDE